ncbi:MAG TPA: GntG family PLP-dependent aldolase [Actinomycetota bacterium]
MAGIRVDLFSDTVTLPTEGMRKAIAEAEVGDEQKFEDPTVNLLQDRVADLLGAEAGLYMPSGTMCNEAAFAVHCRPGDEIIADRNAHPVIAEGGGPAVISGAMVQGIEGERGVFTAQQVREAIRPPLRLSPRSRVMSVENTSNYGGGRCWPIERIREVTAVAEEHGLAAHMDGARLLNAVVATGTAAAAYAEPFDTAWIDFSKGLGAPVGAVLVGSRDLIEEAWRWKQRLGGAMRQAGIVAAACVYALDHHVDRLADDHENARALAEGLADLPGVGLDPETVETNIVVFELEGMPAERFAGRLLDEHGVRVSTLGPSIVRAVTHLDVDREGVEAALAGARAILR